MNPSGRNGDHWRKVFEEKASKRVKKYVQDFGREFKVYLEEREIAHPGNTM